MAKKCIICNNEAVYKIKDTSDYYCEECAEENFADLSILIKVEEEAKRLKQFLESKMDEVLLEENEEREEKKEPEKVEKVEEMTEDTEEKEIVTKKRAKKK